MSNQKNFFKKNDDVTDIMKALHISEAQTMAQLKEYMRLFAQTQLEMEQAQEADAAQSAPEEASSPVSDKKRPSRLVTKDKAISARVNSSTYDCFKRICEARGISANSVLNMLMSDYVREYKDWLEE